MVRNGRRHVSRSAFGVRRRWVSTVRSDSFVRSVASSASYILSLISWFALGSLVRIFPSFSLVSFFLSSFRFVTSRWWVGPGLFFRSSTACMSSHLFAPSVALVHLPRRTCRRRWVRHPAMDAICVFFPSLSHQPTSVSLFDCPTPSTVSVSVTVSKGCGCGCGWTGRQTHPPHTGRVTK